MRRQRAAGRRLVVPAVALLVTSATACRGEVDRAGPPPLPVPVTVLPVVLDEYRFVHRTEVSAGRVIFQARNAGSRPHEVVVVALPADLPGTIGDALTGPTRRAFATLASLRDRAPGAAGTFALDLTKGRYALICFVDDPDGRQHSLKGMSSELRVR